MSKTTHLFGEMDLDLGQKIALIQCQASDIASQCGYAVYYDRKEDCLNLQSQNGEQVKIFHDDGKVTAVKRSVDDGKNWEELDIEENIFKISSKTLEKYSKQINYGTKKTLPTSQGYMLNELVSKYKIPAIRWGYHMDLIGIETNKQFLLWRDCGSHAEFLGLINKDGSKPQ